MNYGVSDLIVSIMLVLIDDQRGLKCCKTEQEYYKTRRTLKQRAVVFLISKFSSLTGFT